MADQVQVITAKFAVDDGPLQKLLKTLELGGKDAEELTAALEKAGVSMDELGKAAEKASKTGTDGFKSLKQQLKEARNDATLLAQKFGENSKQALDAAKRVAQLTEELDDFNQRVKALNPEAKFNAVQQSLQGVLGGLQGVTGALQLFGAESEEVQKIATKLQGALNLAQGINSVIGLKDAFGNLRIVLGLTAAGQTALATATAGTAVATEGAAVAATTFGAALTATGIGAIVVALGGLIAAYVALENQLAKDARALELLTKRQADFAAARKTFETTFNKVLDERLSKLDFEIQKAQARGASERVLLNLQLQRIQAERAALLAATRSGTLLDEAQESVNKRLRETNQQLELTKIKLAALPTEVQRLNKEIEPIKLLPTPKEVEVQTTEALDVVGRTITTKSTDLKPQPFYTEEELAKQQELVIGSFNIVRDFVGDYYQNQLNSFYQADLANLQDLKDKQLLSEEDFNERVKQLKRNQAEEDKKLAIFNATLAFAEALIKALTTKNPPAALILAAAVGGVNLARIIATPIPKFKEGTLNFQGGNMDSDGGSLAMLHPGEAVIPQDRNRMYAPAIRAIFNKQISPREINAFVQNKLNGKIESRVTADVDTYGLARAMRRSNGVTLTNESSLARAIAREMSSTINRRRL